MVWGGIMITMNNVSHNILGFGMGPNLYVSKILRQFPVGPLSSIESVTLDLLADPSNSTKPQFVLVDSVTIEQDRVGDHYAMQKFCSTNQRLEEHKPLTFHKC